MRINDFKMRNSGLDKNCKYHLFTSKKGKEEFIKNIDSINFWIIKGFG